jgi:hypothetical protein
MLALKADYYLSFKGITNFNPDQTSSTAQTFISTKPMDRAVARILSSVTSVEIFADFLYQETQIIPSGSISFFNW